MKNKIIWILLLIVTIAGVVLGILGKKHYAEKKLIFITQFTKDIEISKVIIEAENKYGIDFKLILAIIKKESLFDAKSRNRNKNKTYDYGLMQINTCNVDNVKHALKDSIGRPLNKMSIYDIDVNILGGCLLLREWINFFTDRDAYDDNSCVYFAIEVYNMGLGNWWKGKRNPKHLTSVLMFWTEYNELWEEY